MKSRFKMKTKALPPFTGKRPKRGMIAKFVFAYEPEGSVESNLFRRQLVRVLNAAQGNRWSLGELTK